MSIQKKDFNILSYTKLTVKKIFRVGYRTVYITLAVEVELRLFVS